VSRLLNVDLICHAVSKQERAQFIETETGLVLNPVFAKPSVLFAKLKTILRIE